MERPFVDITTDPAWELPGLVGGFGPARSTNAPAGRLSHAAGLAPGTPVRTSSGLRPVETLVAGDLVVTRDHGLQPLVWASPPITGPVLTLGSDAPSVALAGGDPLAVATMTPGARVLMEDERAELLFGAGEVLGAAEDLVRHQEATRLGGGTGKVIALLFACHALIDAGGFWCESFLPDEPRMQELGALNARALRQAYPRAGHATGRAAYQTVRPVLNRREVALLA